MRAPRRVPGGGRSLGSGSRHQGPARGGGGGAVLVLLVVFLVMLAVVLLVVVLFLLVLAANDVRRRGERGSPDGRGGRRLADVARAGHGEVRAADGEEHR